jgi:hypothetical protein
VGIGYFSYVGPWVLMHRDGPSVAVTVTVTVCYSNYDSCKSRLPELNGPTFARTVLRSGNQVLELSYISTISHLFYNTA